MKNEYLIREKDVVIIIDSEKYGRQEALIDIDNLDLLLKMNVKWHISNPSKYSNTLYAFANIKNENGKWDQITLHRAIVRPHKGLVIDHINHNGLDNRKSNLREITHSQNMQNRKGARKDSGTGIRGVYYDKSRNKYAAHVKLDGKIIFQKRFNSLEEAEKAVIEVRTRCLQYTIN